MFEGASVQSKTDLHSSLEKQLPSNLFLKGFPSWNVPLNSTLNAFPPSVHNNSLPFKEHYDATSIQSVKAIQGSDYIMTCG